MKKNSILTFAFLIATAFGFQTATAQITITLPKIPKIKKPKVVVQPKAEETTQTTTTDGNQTDEGKPSAPPDKCMEQGWMSAHLDDINKRLKEVEEYTPDRGWLVSRGTYNHLLFALSPSARQEWLKDANALDYKNCPNMIAAFDKLAAAAAKKLPAYKADLKDYKVHNAAEEKILRTAFNNIAAYQIFSVGLIESNWLIAKNDFGLPTTRYKHGAFYLKSKTGDYPYCYLTYVNLKQDYAGGGTYGASYATFIRDELVGCPAGK